MLLALALVASFGVTSAFAKTSYTNAESLKHYEDQLNWYETAIADAKAKANLQDNQISSEMANEISNMNDNLVSENINQPSDESIL